MLIVFFLIFFFILLQHFVDNGTLNKQLPFSATLSLFPSSFFFLSLLFLYFIETSTSIRVEARPSSTSFPASLTFRDYFVILSLDILLTSIYYFSYVLSVSSARLIIFLICVYFFLIMFCLLFFSRATF